MFAGELVTGRPLGILWDFGDPVDMSGAGKKKNGGPDKIGQARPRLEALAFLDSADISKKIVEYRRSEAIFVQGDPCDSVMYIQAGAVRLSVLSSGGKEAIVAMLGPGDFLGEGALASQRVRMGTATAVAPSKILVVPRDDMVRLLHEEPGFSDRFIEYMLYRHIRIEEDLVDQLFNTSEKRLARTLLLLARYGSEDKPQGVLPKLSQGVLADMIGTTRSRVNFFMNKFKKLGFIEYNGGLKINSSLLSIFLHE
jgi:CRP/FNR family cyclic AMP-dependent transcriptional regulator